MLGITAYIYRLSFTRYKRLDVVAHNQAIPELHLYQAVY